MLPTKLRSVTYLLSRLPGIGEKTAQRLAMHLASEGSDLPAQLSRALSELSEGIRPCTWCGNLAEAELDAEAVCGVCRDDRRDDRLLCVVSRVQDLLAIEASGAMRGRYFVLGRLLSPLDGVGPEQLPLERLRQLIQQRSVQEVIIATPPSVDGEATALFLGRELADGGLTVTRIASGVPHGGELEYADRITLGRAIDGRRGVVVSPKP